MFKKLFKMFASKKPETKKQVFIVNDPEAFIMQKCIEKGEAVFSNYILNKDGTYTVEIL